MTSMLAMFDDSPETIFSSATGLISHFGLDWAISVVLAILSKDEKHPCVFVLAYPMGRWNDADVSTEHIVATTGRLRSSDNYLCIC